jgi:hypothetical protein
MDNAAEASEASEAASDASAGTSASEAADVVPATLPPSPAAAGGSGGDPAFRADAPRAKPRRTRRRSVVEIGRGALAMVKGTSESPRAGGGAAGPAAIDDSEVDLDSLLALSDEQLEDKLSDKVLTLLKRSTEDLDQPPPVDAIQLLVDGAGRQSSEARAVMVDYLRRRLFSDSVVVRRKALLTLRLLLEHASPAMLPILRANEVALLDIQAMTTFEDAPAAAAAGEGGAAVAAPSSEQVAGLREAATAVLAMTEVKKGAVGKLRSSRLNAAAATDDRISRGRLSSITKTVSGVGSGAIGGAKGFRDVQKQKLLDAKERLAQSRDSQVSGQF